MSSRKPQTGTYQTYTTIDVEKNIKEILGRMWGGREGRKGGGKEIGTETEKERKRGRERERIGHGVPDLLQIVFWEMSAKMCKYPASTDEC